MHVVFDTSAIRASSYELTSPAFQSVLAHSSRLGYHLLIPKVVRGELINQFAEKVHGLHEKAVTAIAEFEQVTRYQLQKVITPVLAQHAIHDYTVRIDQRFTGAGGRYLDYPTVDHEDLVRMDLNGTKPFGANKPSYRDALIWFSILDLLRQGNRPLIFVTGNTRDFAQSVTSPVTLHEDLAEHLGAYGLKANDVELITSIEIFNKTIIVPLLEVDEHLLRQIESGRVGGVDLRAEIRQTFDRQLTRLIPMMNPLVLSIPQPVIQVRYGGLGAIEILESKVNRIDATSIWASLRVGFPVKLVVDADINSRIALNVTTKDFIDANVVRVTVTRPGYASVELVLQTKQRKVTDFKVLMLQIGKWAVGMSNTTADEYFESVSQFALGFGDTEEERWLEETGFRLWQ